ncbi:MAG: hypothetical protein ACJ763_15165 [Bdellovibrionia bacterium]
MLNIASKKVAWVLSLVTLFSSGLALASEAETRSAAASPLFQSDSILEVTLKTDLPQLIRDRSKNYHTASIEVVDPAVRGPGLKMKVSTRGMTSLRTCAFPHLRLKFDTATTQNTILRNLEKVKIVGHCNNPDLGDSKANEQKEVFLQYALYKMYNVLTDYSMRVRLARMHYEDTSGRMSPITKYAFFIEPEESVAARFGAKAWDREELNNQGYSSSNLNATYAGMDEAYQFLIGNGDWRLLRGNTISILNSIVISGQNIGFLAMPFDMDRGGMVNGSFAFHSIYSDGGTFPIVGDDVGTIRSIYTQYYQGRKMYKYAFERFREKRTEMYAVYDRLSSLIDPHYRNRTIGHLDRFFQAIGTREGAEIDATTPYDESVPLDEAVPMEGSEP